MNLRSGRGYQLDESFIQQQHHTNPRRLYSVNATDWQYRVDHERMRQQRLARARAEMEADDLGALLLFAGANIRYVTGSYQGNWKYNINIRYAVLPRGGEPVLFETAGSDMVQRHARPALDEGQHPPGHDLAVGRRRGRRNGQQDGRLCHGGSEGERVEKEKIGVDNLDMPALQAMEEAGLNIVNGWPAMSRARVVKTIDEIEQLKMAASIGDAAMWHIKYEWLKPGVTERQIEAKVHEFMLERGCEIIYDIIVASGGNTSPYRRWATDKLVQQGDLMIVDINAVGPGGYFIDFVRTFKCAAKMNQQEIDLYRETYDSMYAGLENLRPGNTSADVVAKFPKYDDDKYGTVTLQQFAHSIGITLYEGMWMCRAYSMKYPAEIKENMYFAIETFAGHPGFGRPAGSRRTSWSRRTAPPSSPRWSTWRKPSPATVRANSTTPRSSAIRRRSNVLRRGGESRPFF